MNEVTLTVAGRVISGWTDVRITRRCEGVPNDFQVGLTASNPADGSMVVAYAGQPCTVAIDGGTVITGYIDRDRNGGAGRDHRLAILGRGMCADLVDCSAEWKGGQISGATPLDIASKLAQPYGITVVQGQAAPSSKPIPQFNLTFGETAQEIIDRICTYEGLLYYEDAQGRLVLDRVGSTQAASGFVYGQNVQRWDVENSMDGRFSDYVCTHVSIDIFEDTGSSSLLFFHANDRNVPRHRLMYLVAESVSGSTELCESRALWEAARRAGRGSVVRVTADSWRDAAGDLWTPNTLAPVDVPGLRPAGGAQFVIGEVTFVKNSQVGTVAEVMLMPPPAFTPQPTILQPTPFAAGELVPAPS